MVKLAILVPAFNEEENVKTTLDAISIKLHQMAENKLISNDSFIAFIDDGSKDNTWEAIKKYKKTYNNLKALKLSKNYGHQIALFAGIKEFHNFCDCSISVDADLQHDINKIDEFIKAFHSGYEIVIGVSDRKTDSFIKKSSANIFYKFLNLISSSKTEPHHADFRLLSKKAMLEISKHENKNIFLRGIISILNFKKKLIIFNLKKREIGKSKYSIFKMLQLALDGVTSQSTYPLRLSSITGFIILIVCFLSAVRIYYDHYINQNTIPGWATTVLPIYFLGGVQIFFIGIIGEYIAKIYKEVNKSPTYSIKDNLE